MKSIRACRSIKPEQRSQVGTEVPAKRNVLLQKRRRLQLVVLIFVALVLTVFLIGVPRSPPGFCLDESSIAYNAQLIAATGHDEYQDAWPLFFRAFGEYKNPIYIYLLAAVFKLTGPSIAVARSFSAILGAVAALLVAYLAAAISKNKSVGLAVGLSVALTPWLYENSRLVFEVALYPLLIALFLIAVYRASTHERWSITDVISIIATLTLLTYGYSIGRLLGPLLAAGLVVFATRPRYRQILLSWLGYGVALIPLFVFSHRHPGALTARFGLLTYINSESTATKIVWRFITQYARDISPVRMLLTGEDNVRDHLEGTGSILLVTFVLAAAGLVLILRKHWRSSWWQFVIYALIVSIIPAALTTTVFPQIRLIAMPVLINVLSIPAWQFLFEKTGSSHRMKRLASGYLIGLVLLILAQGIYFQVLYHLKAPERGYICDEKFPGKVLSVALAQERWPIYLYDPPHKSGYVQSYWHGLLAGINPSQFVRISDPVELSPGSVVISTEESCANCRLLAKHLSFIVYTPLPSDLHPRYGALPNEAFRAEMRLAGELPVFKIGEEQNMTVLVRNVSQVTWPSVGADDGQYLITVRSRWRTIDGDIMNASDGTRVFYGLDPGDVAGINLRVTAPRDPGNYQLQIDVVQEGVTWFSDKGSQPLSASVSVGR